MTMERISTREHENANQHCLDVLGLHPDIVSYFTPQSILDAGRTQYRYLTSIVHPDLTSANSEASADLLELQAAYEEVQRHSVTASELVLDFSMYNNRDQAANQLRRAVLKYQENVEQTAKFIGNLLVLHVHPELSGTRHSSFTVQLFDSARAISDRIGGMSCQEEYNLINDKDTDLSALERLSYLRSKFKQELDISYNGVYLEVGEQVTTKRILLGFLANYQLEKKRMDWNLKSGKLTRPLSQFVNELSEMHLDMELALASPNTFLLSIDIFTCSQPQVVLEGQLFHVGVTYDS